MTQPLPKSKRYRPTDSLLGCIVAFYGLLSIVLGLLLAFGMFDRSAAMVIAVLFVGMNGAVGAGAILVKWDLYQLNNPKSDPIDDLDLLDFRSVAYQEEEMRRSIHRHSEESHHSNDQMNRF